MAVKRIQWLNEGFNQLRQDPALVAHIDDLSEGVASRAGRGFSWKARTDIDRYRSIIFTDTARAKVVNARDNTLLKELRG